MDTVELIKSKIDVTELLEYLSFESIRHDENFIRCCCKIHGGNNPSSFAIDTETGLWFCHTGGCGGGDIFTLVQKLRSFSFKDSVKFLASYAGLDPDSLVIEERKEKHAKQLKSFLDFMRKKKKQVEMTYFTIPEEVRNVTKFRSFLPDTLRYFNMGYVESVKLLKRSGDGEYTLRNRLVIPIFQNNIQVGLSLRAVKKDDIPKWSHQPAKIATSEMLYNFDIARYNTVIIIVEGIFDVWAYYEIGIAAVCTFGAHLTEAQYKLLLKTGADIVLSYDGDDAGRTATDKAIVMLKDKCTIHVVPFGDKQDPESITREELQHAYSSRRRV